jgi:hypothetical protein
MQLGTFVPYSTRRFTLAPGGGLGKFVAHEELTKNLLRHGVVSKVNIFSTSTNQKVVARERSACEPALAEAFERATRPVFLPLSALPRTVAENEHVFLSSGGLDSSRLGHMRWGGGTSDFMITTLVHSVKWLDLLPFYLGLLVTSRPHDAIVVTSVAAEAAVRAILQWIEENFGVTTEAILARIPLGIDLADVHTDGRGHSRAVLGIDQSEQVVL